MTAAEVLVEHAETIAWCQRRVEQGPRFGVHVTRCERAVHALAAVLTDPGDET